MRGWPIDQLNEGLKIFRDELAADSLACKRVEVAIVTFGPVNVETDFTSAQNFQAPTLSVAGDTPMGQAIETGLSMLRSRKDMYGSNGIAYYRPWVFLITDGDRKSTRLNSSHQIISYAVFCLKKKNPGDLGSPRRRYSVRTTATLRAR